RDLNNVLEAAGLEQLLDGLLNEVEAAARRAGENLDSIDAVMAVGGGSALPWVHQWLQSRLPKTELLVKQPLQAVVLGALAMTPALQVMDVLQ
ncbi:MAG: Hsp70 family protein, partial [Synechococcus sp.]